MVQRAQLWQKWPLLDLEIICRRRTHSYESEHVALCLDQVAKARGRTQLDSPLRFHLKLFWEGFDEREHVEHRKGQIVCWINILHWAIDIRNGPSVGFNVARGKDFTTLVIYWLSLKILRGSWYFQRSVRMDKISLNWNDPLKHWVYTCVFFSIVNIKYSWILLWMHPWTLRLHIERGWK